MKYLLIFTISLLSLELKAYDCAASMTALECQQSTFDAQQKATADAYNSAHQQQISDAKSEANKARRTAIGVATVATGVAIGCAMSSWAGGGTCCAIATGIAISFGLSALTAKKVSDAYTPYDQQTWGGPGAGPTNPKKPDANKDNPFADLPPDLQTKLKDLKKDLEDKGYKFGSDGSVTSPNGVPLNANSSPADLKAAGATDEEIAALGKGLSKIADASKKSDFGYASMGGGGGSRAAAPAPVAMPNFDFGNDRDSQSKKRKPTSLAGLSKKLGDENVGVRGDNIFEMLNRRYQAKDQADAFIKDK